MAPIFRPIRSATLALALATLPFASVAPAQTPRDSAAAYARAADVARTRGARRVSALQFYGPVSPTAVSAIAAELDLPSSVAVVDGALPLCERAVLPIGGERGADVVPGPIRIGGPFALVRVARACRTFENGLTYVWATESRVAMFRTGSRWWRVLVWDTDERFVPMPWRPHHDPAVAEPDPMREAWLETALPFLVVLLLGSVLVRRMRTARRVPASVQAATTGSGARTRRDASITPPPSTVAPS